MKFVYPQIDTVFETDSGTVPCLVIEQQDLLVRLVEDIAGQQAGGVGQAVVSHDNTVLNFAKAVELLDTFIPFDMNRKPLITRLNAELEAAAMHAERYEQTARLMADIENYLYDLAYGCPGSLSFPKLSVASLIKGAGLSIESDHNSLSDRLLTYFEMVTELEREKLFITLNLRSFINDADMAAFLETVLGHGYHLLLIESKDHPRLPNEKRTIIDADLCEIG